MNLNSNSSLLPSPQACTVESLYLPWITYVAGTGVFVYLHHWIAAALFIAVAPCLKLAYLHFFPLFSHLVGHGHVDDHLPVHVSTAPVGVTYYSFLGCPYCPIVEQRLVALQKQMGFTLSRIDVTLRPQLLAAKGIRSVPVVEVGENRIIGHATSEQLAELIARAQPALILKAS